MDGPIEGSTQAFARLAALNPSAQPSAAGTSHMATAAAGGDRTIVLLRPDAVRRALISEICKRFEKRGLILVAMKMMKPGGELAQKHYSPLLAVCSRQDVADAVNNIAQEPVVVTCWRGPAAVSAVCAMVGDEDPAKAVPGTIRGDLSLAAADSLVECADSAEEAARLEALWFEPDELCETAPAPAAAPPAKRAAPASGQGGAKGMGRDGGKGDSTPDRYYLTTAINYANGPPHMGHAYEGVIADVIARYHRAYGREVYFLTGSDEHGQKIADTAAAEGIKPIELCDRSVAAFQDLNRKLGVSNDGYVRTTSEHHKVGAGGGTWDGWGSHAEWSEGTGGVTSCRGGDGVWGWRVGMVWGGARHL